jgi:hypothetical protein
MNSVWKRRFLNVVCVLPTTAGLAYASQFEHHMGKVLGTNYALAWLFSVSVEGACFIVIYLGLALWRPLALMSVTVMIGALQSVIDSGQASGIDDMATWNVAMAAMSTAAFVVSVFLGHLALHKGFDIINATAEDPTAPLVAEIEALRLELASVAGGAEVVAVDAYGPVGAEEPMVIVDQPRLELDQEQREMILDAWIAGEIAKTEAVLRLGCRERNAYSLRKRRLTEIGGAVISPEE